MIVDVVDEENKDYNIVGYNQIKSHREICVQFGFEKKKILIERIR
jgi:hypothetical protein